MWERDELLAIQREMYDRAKAEGLFERASLAALAELTSSMTVLYQYQWIEFETDWGGIEYRPLGMLPNPDQIRECYERFRQRVIQEDRAAMAKVEFTPVWLTRDEDGMPTPEEEEREPLFTLQCLVRKEGDGWWVARVEGHEDLRWGDQSVEEAVLGLPLEVIPRFPQINSIDSDDRTIKRSRTGEIISMAFYLSERPLPRVACPECRGSGEYVGFTLREKCQHCAGAGNVLALPLPR